MLLPTDQGFWEQPTIDRLKTETDETAQKSLIVLLWYAQADAADKAIGAFATDANNSSAARAYAREIMARKDQISQKQRAEASGSTDATLRQKRKERLKAVSDEALLDLDDYTLALAAVRK
jgi:hypothetical protein